MDIPGTSLLASTKRVRFPSLLVIGLNPALQKVLDFDSPIEKNGVNRATSVWTGVGGKGQQCARAAARFRNGSVKLAQFLGGDTGHKVERMLDSSPGGVVQLTQWISAPSRTCTTLCDPGGATEIVEPSGEVTFTESRALMAKIKKQLNWGIDGVVIAGTCPPGVPAEMYTEIATAAKERGVLVLLDGYKDVDSLVRHVDVIKINSYELSRLVKSLDLNITSSSVLEQGAGVMHYCKKSLLCLGITDGANPASLFIRDSGTCFEFELPHLPKVINPIGAGDTVSAIFTHLLCDKRIHGTIPTTEDMIKAFSWALGAGSASCLEVVGAQFSFTDMCKIKGQISVKEIAVKQNLQSLL